MPHLKQIHGKNKEASYYGGDGAFVKSNPLIIANEELPRCREKANIEEYERNLKDADSIVIRLHNIPVLRTGDVQNLNVVNLQLQDNNIERLEPEPFQNLKFFDIISLADNNINEIPSLAFSNLKLEHIDLDNNNIDKFGSWRFHQFE